MYTENRIVKYFPKGACVYAAQWGNRVEIWFRSPTGDSSDVHIFKIPCLDIEQAKEVARLHRRAWNLTD
jgi:hypothetical protein